MGYTAVTSDLLVIKFSKRYYLFYSLDWVHHCDDARCCRGRVHRSNDVGITFCRGSAGSQYTPVDSTAKPAPNTCGSHEEYSHKNSIVEFKTEVLDHCST